MQNEIDANIVIRKLQERIGAMVSQYETEIAFRDAVIEQYQAEDGDHEHGEDGHEHSTPAPVG